MGIFWEEKKGCGKGSKLDVLSLKLEITNKLKTFNLKLLLYSTGKHGNVIVVAVVALKSVQLHDDVVVNCLQVLLAIPLQVVDKGFHSKFFIFLVYRFDQTIGVGKQCEVIDISDKPLV